MTTPKGSRLHPEESSDGAELFDPAEMARQVAELKEQGIMPSFETVLEAMKEVQQLHREGKLGRNWQEGTGMREND
jgi:hypothetical protein